MEQERCKLILGNCLEKMKYISDKSIDLILCDLPYGTTQNEWDSVIPIVKLWKQYERIIKDKGVIVLTSQGLFTTKLILSNEKLFKYKMVWIKSKATNFLNAKKQPLRRHEDIVVFYKKQPIYNPQKTDGKPYNKGLRKNQQTGSYGLFNQSVVKSSGKRYPTDVIYFKTAESEGKVYHSTQKPLRLFEYLIKTYSDKGNLILDSCMGSGTTAVAALNLNRDFIGIEIDKKYFEIAERRIKSAKQQTKLVAFGRGENVNVESED